VTKKKLRGKHLQQQCRTQPNLACTSVFLMAIHTYSITSVVHSLDAVYKIVMWSCQTYW